MLIKNEVYYRSHKIICLIRLFESNEIQMSRYAFSLSLDLPAMVCDVICDLGRERAVCRLCNWIRFNRQLN